MADPKSWERVCEATVVKVFVLRWTKLDFNTCELKKERWRSVGSPGAYLPDTIKSEPIEHAVVHTLEPQHQSRFQPQYHCINLVPW